MLKQHARMKKTVQNLEKIITHAKTRIMSEGILDPIVIRSRILSVTQRFCREHIQSGNIPPDDIVSSNW